jgi:hypothetical protein
VDLVSFGGVSYLLGCWEAIVRFLHPLLLLIDLGGVSLPDISVRFRVADHLVGSAHTMSCWLLWPLRLCALGCDFGFVWRPAVMDFFFCRSDSANLPQ